METSNYDESNFKRSRGRPRKWASTEEFKAAERQRVKEYYYKNRSKVLERSRNHYYEIVSAKQYSDDAPRPQRGRPKGSRKAATEDPSKGTA